MVAPSLLAMQVHRVLECDRAHWQMIVDRLNADPEDADALFALAAYLGAEHQTKEALGLVRDLERIAPEYPGLWLLKARLYEEMGEKRLAAICREKGRMFE